MPLHPSSYALTDVGRKRKKNEDSFLVHEGLGLFIVADGMGGHAGGDVASAEACDQVFSMVKQGHATLESYRATPNPTNAAGVRRVVESAIQAATYMIFGLADQDPARRGMGTTLSCLVVVGGRAFVGQVGDSRVYVIRNGLTTQITEDHTLINAQLNAGYITPEQAKVASYGNIITRAVGVSDHVEVDVYDFDIQAGDRFILCSDGVHGYLENHNELVGLSANRTIEQCAKALVQWALERGGKDNATALVVDIVP